MALNKEKNLRVFIGVTAALHLLQFIAALIVLRVKNIDAVFYVYRKYATWPEDGAPHGFTQGLSAKMPIDIGWCVCAFFLLSGVFQMILVVSDALWTRWYISVLAERGVQPLRWIEYAFSASVLIVTAAIISGVDDFHLVLLLFASNFTVMLLGLAQETRAYFFRQARGVERTWFLEYAMPHVIGWVLYGVIWEILFDKFVLAVTNRASGAKPPGYVYAFYVINLLLFSSFGVVQFAQQVISFRDGSRENVRANSIRSEYAYTALSLVTKSITAWILFGGVLAASTKVN